MRVKLLAAVIVVLAIVLMLPFSSPVTNWIGVRLGLIQVIPDLNGKVVSVSTQQGIVVLSIGSDDGVEADHEFAVYRGEEFIGKVVAKKVSADLTGARVMYLGSQKPVQVNDTVTTRSND